MITVQGHGGSKFKVSRDDGRELVLDVTDNGYTACQKFAEWLNAEEVELQAEAAKLDEQAGLAAATKARKSARPPVGDK